MTRWKKPAAEPCLGACLNSDIENLESGHWRVSLSHRVITRNCCAFDPPIGAGGLDWGLVPRWSPFRGRTFSAPGNKPGPGPSSLTHPRKLYRPRKRLGATLPTDG